MQILSVIQQGRNGVIQNIPSLLQESKCPDVYILKSLFTHKFFEELHSMVESVFNMNSMDYILLSEIGFVQEWQSILDFFIIPVLENTYSIEFSDMNLHDVCAYIIRKYSNNDTNVYYNTINYDNAYNILLPLSPGGEISFKR